MARRGENIYKRKDNRWEGRFVKGCDASGKPHYGYVYAKSYREVREKLSAAKLTQTVSVDSNQKTMAHFCDEWLILSRNRVKASTYVKYHTAVHRHLIPNLGHYMPQQLNAVLLESFSNALLQDGLSAKTVRDILVIMKSVWKHCRRTHGAGFPDIDIIFPKEHKKEMRVLNVQEQQQLVRYLMTDMDSTKFGVLLALLTGMRIGEICALKWAEISVAEKLIHICASMQRLQSLDAADGPKTKIVIGETKSYSSKRVIPMTEFTIGLCKQMQAQNENAYVLTGDAVRFMEPRAMQYRVQKYLQECDLQGVHFHTLRHTFATRCVEVGFEIKSLSEVLGHSSAKVTLDRYVHVSLDLKRANMEKLQALGL